MERHGYDQPTFHHLQQPDPRRPARAAVGRIPQSRILPVLCQQWAADLRSGSKAMSGHQHPILPVVASLLLIASLSCVHAEGSEADFKTAYAAADTAEKEAGVLRNQWTTTESTLAAARKAADAGRFDQAAALSKEAEALAKASIFQATSEKDAWKAQQIR